MQARLAVLIDADNAQADLIEPLLKEVTKYGVASVKRIYGDWTQARLGGWKKKLVEHAIQPMQQFGYTTGKNSTDSALIIDAMDLLYTEKFDGFCLVSSDSDFTRLATRLREAGLTVYGFGEKKTPRAFIGACDKFIYVENLRPEPSVRPGEKKPAQAAAAPAVEPTAKKASGARKRAKPAVDVPPGTGAEIPAPAEPEKPAETDLDELLTEAVDACADESGWAHLGSLGQYISKQQPDFDSRTYGKKRLSDLVKTLDSLVVEARPGADGKSTAIYVHRK
ncbi:NYN domain-containing protein [Hydrocarboniphaga effusa]|jgi:uncharacterized LabA/DUF88 family protein|uniref:NYN domain-containing protein n=1 Tax=Hydrocarboniphaga effusa TaxID=243629 RepID=UPI0031377DF2